MCPALRRHTAKKTKSACKLVVSAAGPNIYILTISIERNLELKKPNTIPGHSPLKHYL